ncbi:Beta-glucosidase 6 [Frankliniella fusca]|uniref:Beta-glucosidase 6 n=1 Tax=Frankliniella fusca TaxID=407009 RepID=A0AAE1LLR1_9NEOP|nr:Beta-glucosidase 6 [Frankliniella fusca]
MTVLPRLQAFLRALVTTVKEFGVRVPAYCAWSLIDSWEWSAGYKQNISENRQTDIGGYIENVEWNATLTQIIISRRNFGLVHVDIAGGSYNRSLKDSSQFWIELAKQRAVPAIDVPSGSHENSKSSISGTPFYSQ